MHQSTISSFYKFWTHETLIYERTVPPKSVTIVDSESGQKLEGTIGPFKENSNLRLICEAEGGTVDETFFIFIIIQALFPIFRLLSCFIFIKFYRNFINGKTYDL